MKIDVTDSKFLTQMIKYPETVIDRVNLVYINDDKLSIFRLKEKKGFLYQLNGQPLTQKKEIDRINNLVIPPAWQNVRISVLDNGHLQATGRDQKNRKQYRYHPLWNTIRNQTKFYKMTAFAKQLPKIRRQIDIDLDQNTWGKNKVLALVIRLMEETHIRIGNEQYAKRNKTYGLSTMRTRHVKLLKDKLKFEFTGKKGKKHSITLRNKKLIRLVNRCEEIPGWELFQYYDENGIKQSVDSGMINNYIHQICGDIFSAKDYRTWAASTIFFETLMEIGISSNEKEIQKNILKAYDAAAAGLGNTRNVCRKYYVHPILAATYQDSSIENFFEEAKMDSNNMPSDGFSNTEKAILKILADYTPTFLDKNM